MIRKNVILAVGILFGVFGYAQNTVTGTVTDKNEAPLPGVTVIVVGTTVGSQTDFDGNYTINAEQGSELEFSYLGMTTQTVEVTSNTINVQLAEDASKLDEVVVTALGIKRSERSTSYASPTVKSGELTIAKNDNAISSLSGKVAGVQVNSPSGNLGGSQRILIRGANSITGNNQPLFVIDGIQMDNSNFNSRDAQRGAGGVDFGSTLNDINPNDIESVTVLKGSAAALYGSRASNGVVLITTKSGKKGANKGLGVSVNSSVSVTQVAILPNLQREYGGGSKETFDEVTINGTKYKVAEYATDESWGPKLDGTSVLHWDAFDKESFPEDYLKPRPWVAAANDVDSFFELGVTYDNSVSISSADDKGSTIFSLGQNYTEGTLPTTNIKKVTSKLKFDRKLNDHIKVDAGLNYVRTEGKRGTVGYDSNSVTQKFFQWGQRQLDMERLKKYKNQDGTQRTWNRKGWDDANPQYSDNPYWIVNESYPTDLRNRVFGNASVSVSIIKGLNVKGSLYADTYNFETKQRISIGSQEQSKYTEEKYNVAELNQELIATYTKDINDFTVDGMLGVNKRVSLSEKTRNETQGGLSIKGIYAITNSKGGIVPTSSVNVQGAYQKEKQVNSVFGNANIGYKNQVFLNLTARNDWSTALPDSNNSYFYPSAGLSWVFSDTFLKDNPIVSFGKFRASWSQVGNDTDSYRAKSTYFLNTPLKNVPRTSLPETKLNSNLKSETTTTTEFGIELGLLKQRLNIDLTYYENRTTDQIVPVDVSYSTGYLAQYINAGEMENKGIELSINGLIINADDFKWDATLNFTQNRNKLVSLPEGTESILLSSAPFRGQVVAYVGQSYGTIMGTDFVYKDGQRVINSDGTYKATDDSVPLGSVLPDYTAGLRNTFTYKDFSLSVLLDTSQGGKYISTSHMWGMYSGMLQETVANGIRENGIVLKGVTEDGKPNTKSITAQKFGTSHYGNVDAQNVFGASYIKLREVTLGYTFPKSIIPYVQDLRLSAYARNLLTFGLDYDGIDPETVSAGSGNIQGLEGGLLPSTRVYGFSLNVTF